MNESVFYDIHGAPISRDRWVQLFDMENRRLGYTRIWGDLVIEVSTVWLGLDHRYSQNGPPLIFETMIFGGDQDGETARYSTQEDAIRGHNEIVSELLAKMPGARVETEVER